MKNIDSEQSLFSEDSIMEDCLLELPPFGSFPMRGFRSKKMRKDSVMDAAKPEVMQNFAA